MKCYNGIKNIQYLLNKPNKTIRMPWQQHTQSEKTKITQLEFILAHSV